MNVGAGEQPVTFGHRGRLTCGYDVMNSTPDLWRPTVVSQASRLADVRYDIRGPVLRRARALEAAGHEIIKLNIGNPAPFGLFTPDAVLSRVTNAIADSQGYSDARGIAPAREGVGPSLGGLG